MKTLEKTNSLCPICFTQGIIQKIPADVVEEDEKIWISKHCTQHGFFKEPYFNDAPLYKRWLEYKRTGNPVPELQTHLLNEQKLYENHISQTMLTNLIVTNREDQNSSSYNPTESKKYIYEPTLDQLKTLMQQTRNEKPIGSKNIQITGGEPTLRDDLFDILKIASEVGFSHIQLYTNGLKLAEDAKYCQCLKNLNVNSVYLVFNGTTKETNPLLEQNKKTIENLQKNSLNTVLVPTLRNDKNIAEVGKIVRFALEHVDSIRGVHFQPICFCGDRAEPNEEKRKQKRVDYSSILLEIEKEFNGMISRDDFYPFSFIFPMHNIIETMVREPQIKPTPHPGCGGSTYIFVENGKPIPITRFIDVEADMHFLIKQAKKKGPLRKLRIGSAFIRNINTFVDYSKAPQGFDSKKFFKNATIHGSHYALQELHHKGFFIGFMGHMDPWNMDFERLQRCVIHCPTFEGILPYCMYNGLGYSEKLEKKYSISSEEWKKKNESLLQK